MTRRLLALSAPSMLAAQVDITIQNGRIIKRVPSIPRPKNGECPVCGTMAEPYKRKRGSDWEAAFTACSHCNNIFRQWVEGKEPKR